MLFGALSWVLLFCRRRRVVARVAAPARRWCRRPTGPGVVPGVVSSWPRTVAAAAPVAVAAFLARSANIAEGARRR
eukprot:6404674-Alexandrium_andersonii.AAC.1